MFGNDRRALARAITVCERRPHEMVEILSRASSVARGAARVGVTGPPGVGKSTFTDKLIAAHRAAGRRVAVVAVDPSSPVSGGSLLGDRVRMGTHSADPDVFIRSIASGGRLGGLAPSTESVAVLLDAAGYDPIIFETVGVGQSEVEVAQRADTVVVVTAPGFGDGVQAEKAGLLEVGDVFVVNKGDLPGARDAARLLEAMVAVGGGAGWVPPVLVTVAESGDGVDAVAQAIAEHARHLHRSGEIVLRRAGRARQEIVRTLETAVARRLATKIDAMADEVLRGAIDPWTAADVLVAAMTKE